MPGAKNTKACNAFIQPYFAGIAYYSSFNMEKLLFSTLGLIFGALLTIFGAVLIMKSKEKKSDNIIEKAKKEAEKTMEKVKKAMRLDYFNK